MSLSVVVAVDLEAGATENPLDAIDGIWTFSSRTTADVFVGRRIDQDPTKSFATFDVDLDDGIRELPTKESSL